MRSPEIAINTSQYLENGIKITAVKKDEYKESDVIPGSTAKHEADHICAAHATGTHVVSATIIPGPGYNGMTQLSEFNAIAAAAAHAHGHGGTGHDMSIIRASGISEGAAISAARSTLSNMGKERHAVASLLQRKGSVSGHEIKEAIAKAQRKEEAAFADVFILSPDGKENKIEAKTNGNTVMVPGEWVTLTSSSR